MHWSSGKKIQKYNVAGKHFIYLLQDLPREITQCSYYSLQILKNLHFDMETK